MASDPSPSAPPEAPVRRGGVARLAIGLVLLLLGLAGLAMSLCGGVFTVAAFVDGKEMLGALPIALIALAAGAGLIWLAVILNRRLRRR